MIVVHVVPIRSASSTPTLVFSLFASLLAVCETAADGFWSTYHGVLYGPSAHAACVVGQKTAVGIPSYWQVLLMGERVEDRKVDSDLL